MSLDKNKFSLAAAATMGIAYVACGIAVVLAPEAALKFWGWMFHMVNLEEFLGNVGVTPAGFVIGLIETLVYTYVAAWIFVWIYNRLVKGAVV